MAIKTKAALVTQSDNTFPDNTTGLIVPEEHREFNDDSLDTMFAIAGRTLTISAFNTLRTDNELVPGCNYRFSQINIPAMAGNPFDLIVTALTDSTILDWGIIVSSGSFIRAFVPQDIDTDLIKVAEIQTGSPDAIADFLPLAAAFRYYGWTEIPVVPTMSDNFPVIHERISTIDGFTVLNNNIEAEAVFNQKIVGFHAHDENLDYQPEYFFPDNGNEFRWGWRRQYLGEYSTLAIDSPANVTNIDAIKGNWVKVNNTIMGMVSFICSVDNFQSLPEITFNLPHFSPEENDSRESVIGHGSVTYAAQDHTILMQVRGATDNKCRAIFHIQGNHDNELNELNVCISFSYNILPSA